MLLTLFQIGFKHGNEANVQIARTIEFYTGMFKDTAHLDWPQVREVAMTYEPVLAEKWPRYLEEMKGTCLSTEAEGQLPRKADVSPGYRRGSRSRSRAVGYHCVQCED